MVKSVCRQRLVLEQRSRTDQVPDPRKPIAWGAGQKGLPNPFWGTR